MATDYGSFSWPGSSGGGSGSNASVGTNGSAIPSSSTQIAGENPSGNLQPLQTDASGNLLVSLAAEPGAPLHVIVDSSALPTGASTSALQSAGNASLVSIDAGIPASLGQTTSSASMPVVIASDQSPLPVSAASLPLPAGAATSANQTNASQKTQLVDGSGNVIASTSNALNVAVQGTSTIAGTVAISQVTPGSTNNVTLSGVGGTLQSSISARVLPSGTLLSSVPQKLFDDTFATSSVLDTINRWNSPVASGGGVAAAVPVGGGDVALGSGTTGSGYSYLQSQPTFQQLAPGFIEIYHAINLEFPVTTNAYRFWGIGTVPGTPTTSAALTDAVGWEVATTGKMFAVCWSGGTRNVIQDLSSSGNNSQPGDALVHKYFIFYRGDLIYWAIDNESNIVATMLTGAPGPINNTLPLVLLSVAGSTPPASSAVITDNAVFVGDTTSSSGNIADGVYPWRKASVDVNNNLYILGQDLLLAGAAAQTATVNNILTLASGTAANNLAGYRSASVQVTSTGTAGTFIFEGSNDNVNFQTIPVYNQLILTGTPIAAAITASASQIIYSFPITTQYVRLRIATTITGGSIQAFSRFSQAAFAPAITQAVNATAANLQTTATIASGTVTTVSTVSAVTSSNSGIPGIIADVASAAITTTTTTAAFTPTFGSSYMIDIPVTAVSGTTPTMVVQVQESPDTGTNWYTVYTFPTITANGSYTSPVITLTGNRVRYVQTIAGTTPSFTRAINRLQSSQAGMAVPSGTIFTDRSGTTSGTPSTSTQIAAANNQRRYFVIQNLSLSAPIYINFTSNATAGSGSLYLAPLASYAMESSTITTEAINVLATVASIAFTAKEG